MKHGMVALCACALAFAATPVGAQLEQIEFDGYLGIWYANQATNDEYVYKYSGGLGTYTADHIPIAIYRPEVEKTFFAYGGTLREKNSLAIMISYYDHKDRMLPRPFLIGTRGTDDAHDNPALVIDSEGHLWVFLSSHGRGRPSYIVKSREPYSINSFEQVAETNFSYPQPWYFPGKGFLFLHTWYEGGRGLYWQHSPDGITWPDRTMLSHMDQGHYQISWPRGEGVGTAFNYHPEGLGLNHRTNLYYLETRDMGQRWQTVEGVPVEIPLRDKHSPALVHEYEQEGEKIYACDLDYDQEGRPIILYVTSRGWQPGPQNDPRGFRVAHWTGATWARHDVASTDNNYDMGSIYVDRKVWRVFAPTDPGPQQYNPGGEMVIWRSEDAGHTWTREHQVTQNSRYNHTYARKPLNAHPGFMAFWADGDTREVSESRLYFWDDEQKQVYRMPAHMEGATTPPEPYSSPER